MKQYSNKTTDLKADATAIRRESEDKMDKYKELLQSRGCENIESYCLISNWGYRFTYKGLKCDIRYWANCYGACLDRFEIHTDKHKAVELCIWIELQDIENSMNELAKEE